jgi:hypothetical protein
MLVNVANTANFATNASAHLITIVNGSILVLAIRITGKKFFNFFSNFLRTFFLFLGITLSSSIYHFGVGIYLIVDYIVDESRIKHKGKKCSCLSKICVGSEIFSSSFNPVAYIVIVAFFVALCLPAIYLLGQLFLLHLRLSTWFIAIETNVE